jgi:ATP-dependent protease HslVU (ClpYQ) peptidase subunit
MQAQSVNSSHATIVAQALETHMKTLPSDKKVVVGGDWNVTLGKIIFKSEQFLLNKSPL